MSFLHDSFLVLTQGLFATSLSNFVHSLLVGGKAETCSYTTSSTCQCGLFNPVDYTGNIMCGVLMAGIYDTDIRQDILGVDGILHKTINDIIALVEKRKMARNAHPSSNNVPIGGLKPEQPKVDVDASMEEWNIIERRWNATPQLFQCASDTLGNELLKMDPGMSTKNLDDVPAAMKALAVIPVATGVLCSELLYMKQ